MHPTLLRVVAASVVGAVFTLARPAAACDRSSDPEPFDLLASGVSLLDVTGTVEDPPGAGLAIAPDAGGASVAVDDPVTDCDAWFSVGARGRLLVPAGQGLNAGVFVANAQPALLAALAAYSAANSPQQRVAALIEGIRRAPDPHAAARALVRHHLHDVRPTQRRALRKLARGKSPQAVAAAYVLVRLPTTP